jgi:peptide/nickel transport system ATP-binding protein
VRIRDAEKRYDAYPFELSGGMCQRVVIAIALACDPRLLIADEPTTGLDITTQKAVMDLVRDLIRERGMSAILITHDLGLAAQYCDRIAVMKDGEIVERARRDALFGRPSTPIPASWSTRRRAGRKHPRLLPAEARTPEPPIMRATAPLLEVRDLVKTYQGKSGPVHAVKGISFTVRRAERGPGGRKRLRQVHDLSMLVRLWTRPRAISASTGEDIAAFPAIASCATAPRQIQMVFQDATDSLNPRHSARQTIAEPLRRLSDLRGRALRPDRGTGHAGRSALAFARPLSASAFGRAEGPRGHRAGHRA